jgi:hypothetical protein
MDIEIYCDESNQQLLSAKEPPLSRFLLIGGLWLPVAKRQQFKESINRIRQEEGCFGEIKWRAVCPSKLHFYLSLVDFFFNQGNELRFRCIAVDTQKVDLELYHEADQELGFYKFCYQLLKNWIEDFNTYSIFFDMKSQRIRGRLRTLERFLHQSNLLARVDRIQALPSRDVVIMQLADLLLGAVSSKFNQSVTSVSKTTVIERIEHHLGHEIWPTARDVKKFNVFKISLR